jgi:PTS system nitrogen regulatory IIA component
MHTPLNGHASRAFMHLTDLLSADRVAIRRAQDGPSGGPLDKSAAIALLADLLARGGAANAPDAPQLDDGEVERVLLEREKLQSTGIGEGVAIPHGALAQLASQVAALLIVPGGIDFAAIDERKVSIIFAVIGPKRATGEHLKTLARVSRLLRNQGFRDRLIASESPQAAFDLIATEEGEPR